MIEIDYRDDGEYFKGMKKPEYGDPDFEEYAELFGELEGYEQRERVKAYVNDPNAPDLSDWYGPSFDDDDDDDDEEYESDRGADTGMQGAEVRGGDGTKGDTGVTRLDSPKEEQISPFTSEKPADIEEERTEGIEDPGIVRSREMIAQSRQEWLARLEQMWVDREEWLKKRTQCRENKR